MKAHKRVRCTHRIGTRITNRRKKMKVTSDRTNIFMRNSYLNKYNQALKPMGEPKDTVEISQMAKMLMEDDSVIRVDKIEKLQSLISKGLYTLNSSDVANKMINDAKLSKEINSEEG